VGKAPFASYVISKELGVAKDHTRQPLRESCHNDL
jgi:hypothetical protein